MGTVDDNWDIMGFFKTLLYHNYYDHYWIVGADSDIDVAVFKKYITIPIFFLFLNLTNIFNKDVIV